ncbi:tetratricopeptide repeat protein [Algibacter pacificus]|uniref:tetratricopeptide repeat protein n=1 Tax=Algibacter pacificus TaxID=2599389 RepID=UPI0011C96315|nr:hypothetical protein [Algibacter pacificus]
MEEKDYIQFEDYLFGTLSKTETEVFENKLKTNNAFAEAFQTYKNLSNYLSDKYGNETESAAFRANLSDISNKYFKEKLAISEEKSSKKPFEFYKYVIAACVVVMLGVFTFNQFSSPSYSDFNNFDPVSLTVRGENDALLKIAEKAFNSRDFAAAEKAFAQLIETDQNNEAWNLYNAISKIELNHYDEADDILTEIANGNSAYKNKAIWYLALSKLKQEDTLTCIDILKTIPEDADDYERAQKLLDQLD